MKYGFIVLEIQDGEHGYYSHSVVQFRTGTIQKYARQCAEMWYEGENHRWDEGEVDFTYMCVRVRVHQAREISKEHYEVLNQYL